MGLHSQAKVTSVTRIYLRLIARDSTGLKDNITVLPPRIA